MDALFVIGTDTGVGKTMITGLFGRYLRKENTGWVTPESGVQNRAAAFPEDVYTHLSFDED
jgi:hypothetical protein